MQDRRKEQRQLQRKNRLSSTANDLLGIAVTTAANTQEKEARGRTSLSSPTLPSPVRAPSEEQMLPRIRDQSLPGKGGGDIGTFSRHLEKALRVVRKADSSTRDGMICEMEMALAALKKYVLGEGVSGRQASRPSERLTMAAADADSAAITEPSEPFQITNSSRRREHLELSGRGNSGPTRNNNNNNSSSEGDDPLIRRR
jgi:hypothetical protein